MLLQTVRRAVFERLRLLRDLAQLRGVARVTWPSARLAPLTPAEIRDVMEAPRADPDTWLAVDGALGSVGIHEQTGGINPGDRRALHALLAWLRPGAILEVGTHIGASTLTMAASLRALGLGGSITTVDILDVNASDGPWRAAGLDACPRDLLGRIDARDVVEFCTDTSQRFLRGTAQDFDLVFLDGSHTAAAVYGELPLAVRSLRPGGWIVLHDYFPHLRRLWRGGELIHGPWLAAERLRREGAALDVAPFGELPWPTKHDSHVTSLAAIARA